MFKHEWDVWSRLGSSGEDWGGLGAWEGGELWTSLGRSRGLVGLGRWGAWEALGRSPEVSGSPASSGEVSRALLSSGEGWLGAPPQAGEFPEKKKTQIKKIMKSVVFLAISLKFP